MKEEIEILDVIRRTVLHLDPIAEKLKFTDEQPTGKTERRHLHNLFEMRILFDSHGVVAPDYTRVHEIRLTPPQLPHDGLAVCDLRRHMTLRISADEIYYLRGTSNVISFSITPEMNMPEVNFAALAAALADKRLFEQDQEYVRVLIALLLSALRRLLADDRNIAVSPAEIIAGCIRANYYRSDLSIREIAEMTRFSPNYIQKVFRSGRGCTPIEYLNEIRLNAAHQLLLQHRWQIKEVAAMCGWNYAHYFSRRYKERFGTLPGDE